MSVESILAQLKQERDRIDAAIQALSAISTKKSSRGEISGGKRPRRKLSAEARKRIADAQRKRWAAKKAGK